MFSIGGLLDIQKTTPIKFDIDKTTDGTMR